MPSEKTFRSHSYTCLKAVSPLQPAPCLPARHVIHSSDSGKVDPITRTLTRKRPLMYILIVVILIVILLGGLPAFGLGGTSYWPSGIAGIILLVLLILLLTGRL